MESITLRPVKHILVCVNEKENNKDCCGKVQGYEIFRALKDWTKLNGLSGSVWVTRTGCLGFCNNIGATVVIYPDQIWFKEVKINEVEKIKEMIMESLRPF